MMVLVRYICILVLLALMQPGYASSTGLIVMPVADTVEVGMVDLTLESAGTSLPFAGGATNFIGSEFGLLSSAEIGVDEFLEGSGAVADLKYRFINETRHAPALAIGVQNLSSRFTSQPYVVASKNIGTVRGHLGAISIRHRACSMLGIEQALGTNAILQADYIAGHGSLVGFGVVVEVSDSVAVTLGRIVDNTAESGSGYLLSLDWVFPYAKR